MGGSSKTQQTTQSVAIPQDVLARYNAVNTSAQSAASTPFQSYSSDPNAFVAPMNATQNAGVAGTNAYANSAQPYFDAATGQLTSAQNATAPYYSQATQDLSGAQGVGNLLAGSSLGALGQANASAQPYTTAAGANYGAAYTGAQPYNGAALGSYYGGQTAAGQYQDAASANYGTAYNNAQGYNTAATGAYQAGYAGAQPLQGASAGNIGQAQSTGYGLGSQALGTLDSANAASTPLQYGALGTIAGSYAGAQPANAAATAGYGVGLAGSQGYNAQAAGNIAGAQNVGTALGAASLGTLAGGQGAAGGLQSTAQQGYSDAQAAASPYNSDATGAYLGALNSAQPLQGLAAGNVQSAQAVGNNYAGQSAGALGQGQSAANPLYAGAVGGIQSSLAGAQPFNAAAAGQYTGALSAAAPGNAAAGAGYNAALGAGAGYNALSGAYTGAGAGAVNPTALDANSINQYMNPYLSSVLGSTSSLLNQNNQQAQAGQLGNAITSGAFGGDRAGIAAANLNQQQMLANANIYSGISSDAYKSALGAAQQQQGVGLAAGQANRAAVQNAATQYLNLGQQGYAQQLGAAQGQQGLANQQFNQATTAGQGLQSVGQQQFAQGQTAAGAQAGIAGSLYNQGLTSSQQLGALGGQQFGQGLAASQQQQALGQQNYSQLANLGSNLQGVGQQTFAQGQSTAGAQAALGQQEFGQGLSAAQQQQSVGAQLSGLGLSAAGAQAGLGQNVSNQYNAAAQGVGNIGQQGFQQGQTAGQNTSAIGSTLFGQGATTAGQQAAIGQNLSGLDLSAAQQQAALGQQTFGQGAALGSGLQNIGSTVNAQGNTLAGAQQSLGAQVFGQGQQVGSNVANLGQQQYTQGMGLGSAQQGLGGQLFSQGATTAGQLGALGQQQFGQGVTASQQAAGIGQDIYGTGAATSQALAGLGSGAQAAGLQGAAAQLAAGQVGQQTQQAGDTALYNQFLQQQSYPFQVQQFLANIAEGTGALSGSTTTTTQPGGFFSDERLKEDIRPVGRTFDGQTIHSYRYKGDPRTQIGLIAQDVERRHPDAVGLSSGYKTVDYDKATDAAAERGHFARGGLSANDNAWSEPRRALAYGGYGGAVAGETPMDVESYLQAAESAISPYGAGGLYGSTPAGGPHGGATGYVPSASLPVGHLAVAQGMPTVTSPMENATQIADLVGKGKSAVDWAKGMASRRRTGKPTDDDGAGDDYSHKAGGKVVPFRANGGPIDDMPKALDIPDDKPGATSLPLPSKPPEKPKSGFEELLGLAQTAAAFVPKKRGGRTGMADGGDPTDDSDLPQVTVPLTDPDQSPGNTLGRRLAAGLPISGPSKAVAGLAPAIGEGLSNGPTSARIPISAPVNAALDARFRADIPRLATAGEGPAMDAARTALRTRRDQAAGVLSGLQTSPAANPTAAKQARLDAMFNGPGPSGGPTDAGAVAGQGLGAALASRPPSAPQGIRATGVGRPTATPTSVGAGPSLSASPPPVGLSAGVASPMAQAPVSPSPLADTPANMAVKGPMTQADSDTALAGKGPLAGPQKPSKSMEHALATVGHGLGGALRDPNVLLSVLSGIAAMGTAPTVHPGVALAAGLGAGAQTYLGARQQSADIARTQAGTAVEQAQATQGVPATAQAAQASAWAQFEAPFKEKNLTLIEDPGGQIIFGTKHYKAVPTGSLVSSVASNTGAGQPAPDYTYLGTNGRHQVGDAFQRAVALPPEVMSHEYAAQTAATDAAQEAQGTLPTYFRWASSVTGARGTPAEAGAWNGVRTDAINQWNLLMGQMGLPDARVTGLDDAQMARKSSVGAAALREAGMGMRSATGLIGLMQATPNPDMTSNAQLQLIADAMTDQMRMIDHAQHQREFSDAVGRQYGPSMANTFRTQDETNAFQHDFTPQKYLQDRAALMRVFQNPQFATIARGLQGPNAEANARALDEFYHTPGLHAYWTGNRGFGQ